MKAVITQEQIQADIAKVVELRKTGMSRASIIKATGFKERFVREHMAGVEVESKPAAKPTQLSTAASRAYTLAIRPQGCKDHELAQIVYEVYGTKFDAEKGIHVKAWTADTLRTIKKRCRDLAEGEDLLALFVPDWVNDARPIESRISLEQFSLELSRRMDDMVTEFLCQHMVEPESDRFEMTEAQKKQKYGARRYILKLAFPEFRLNAEPVSTLLARSDSICAELEATQDLPLVQAPIKYFESAVVDLESFGDVFDDVEVDAGNIDPFFAEVDIFADVATATKEQIVINKAQQDAKIAAFTEALSSDDGVQECDSVSVKEIDDYTDEEYDIPLEVQSFMAGFDITKYVGGRKNVEGVSFS